MTDDAPRLLTQVDDEVRVDFGRFALQLQPSPENTLAFEMDQGDRPATVGPAGVLFQSPAIDHYPAVRLELWTKQPSPDPATDWQPAGGGRLAVPQRRSTLRLRGEDGRPTPVLLELEGSVEIRTYVRGQDEAKTRGEAQFFHGVEQWLVQIWPAERP